MPQLDDQNFIPAHGFVLASAAEGPAQSPSWHQAPSPSTTCPSTSQAPHPTPSPGSAIQLPGFLKPLPANIDVDDAAYLNQKGALDLPALSLQNALLEAFVNYVHSHLPVIDLPKVLHSIQGRDGRNGQVSLLLYQAIMFAACSAIDIEGLLIQGYASREEAQDTFFHRTRLLYDLDYEPDRLVAIQALLLMSYRQGPRDDCRNDGWYWTGVALSLAYTIDLHRPPSSTESDQGLRRRLWWSCFVQERLMALGSKKPTRIRDEDFDVPMLDEKDFDYRAVTKDITIISQKCKTIRYVKLQQDMAKLFIAKAQLCVCLGYLNWASGAAETALSGEARDGIVTKIDQELMAWAEALPTASQHRTVSTLDMQNGRSPIVVQRTFIHMLHNAAVAILHREEPLPSPPTAPKHTQQMSRLRVREAVLNITRMADELHRFKIDKYLPAAAATVLLSVIVVHVLQIRSGTAQSRQCARQGFQQCMEVMKELEKVYSTVGDAIRYLDILLQKSNDGSQLVAT